MSDAEKGKRKVWTIGETKALLACYMARKEEFYHCRKKRSAYTHILEDMMAQGFTDPSLTIITLESKMRTLLSAYKSAKDNARHTGASPCIAPYMQEMDEIFGDSAIISNAHTLHMGRGPCQALKYENDFIQHQTQLFNGTRQPMAMQTAFQKPTSEQTFTQEQTESPTYTETLQQPPTTINTLSLVSPTSPTTTQALFQKLHSTPITTQTLLQSTTNQPIITTTPSPQSSQILQDHQDASTSRNASRKRKSAREVYYESKLELKRKIAEEKSCQRQDFYKKLIALAEKNDKEKTDLLQKLFQ